MPTLGRSIDRDSGVKHVNVEWDGMPSDAKRVKAEGREVPLKAEGGNAPLKAEGGQAPLKTLIGLRLSILFWQDDPPTWFSGVIKGMNAKGHHRVKFDDGQSYQPTYDIDHELSEGLLRWEDTKSNVEVKIDR